MPEQGEITDEQIGKLQEQLYNKGKDYNHIKMRMIRNSETHKKFSDANLVISLTKKLLWENVKTLGAGLFIILIAAFLAFFPNDSIILGIPSNIVGFLFFLVGLFVIFLCVRDIVRDYKTLKDWKKM